MTKTILYARVSTKEQTLAHQREQAERAGFKVDEVVSDHGVSGVSTALRDRPQGRRLFDMLRRGDVLLVRWIDRLGRNYLDVTSTIREFMERGVIVRTVINDMTFDGAITDPQQMAVRDALLAFMAAMAQAQAEATKDAQKAGITHAQGKNAYKGRKPAYRRRNIDDILALVGEGVPQAEIARRLNLSRATVIRISREPDKMRKALEDWGL
jgi:Site-specific recombinases, DNA invertase Pin homologs